MELTTNGLNAFKCGKNRKNYGEFRKWARREKSRPPNPTQ
jgi:hypothetical protein